MLDASVALKWFLPELLSSSAERLLNGFLKSKLNLHAPDLLLLETANALWKRSALGHGLSSADVQAIYRDLVTIPLNFDGSEQLAGAALDLAISQKHSVYDAGYCALAVNLDCELITADSALVSKLAGNLPFVRHLSTFNL